MKVTIQCPRCFGRVFIQAYLDERGVVAGYEARCLNCARDWTDHLKRKQQRVA